jgi:hypothetical protein
MSKAQIRDQKKQMKTGKDHCETHEDAGDQDSHVEGPLPSNDIDRQTPEKRSGRKTSRHRTEDDTLSTRRYAELLVESCGEETETLRVLTNTKEEVKGGQLHV